MLGFSWDKICEEAERRDIPSISLAFYKQNGRFPTKKELKKIIKNVILPDYNNIDKNKIYPTKQKFYKYLKNEQ